MTVPSWNMVEPESSNSGTATQPASERMRLVTTDQAGYDANTRVRINTIHEGRASYTESGITTYSIEDIIDYMIDMGEMTREDQHNGLVPSEAQVREYGRELMYEHGEIDDYEDCEYDNHDQDDWHVQSIDIYN